MAITWWWWHRCTPYTFLPSFLKKVTAFSFGAVRERQRRNDGADKLLKAPQEIKFRKARVLFRESFNFPPYVPPVLDLNLIWVTREQLAAWTIDFTICTSTISLIPFSVIHGRSRNDHRLAVVVLSKVFAAMLHHKVCDGCSLHSE